MSNQRSNTHSFDWRLACEVGVEKALLISNFQFWIAENEKRKSATHLQKGEYWTYATGKELVTKFPYFKAPSLYRWLTQLEADGWLKTAHFNEKVTDRTTWYGRGEKLIKWLNPSIYQNEKWVYQNDKSNYQNENETPENEGTNYHFENDHSQNDNSDSQNEKCIYKDTDTNTDLNSDLLLQQPEKSGEVAGAAVEEIEALLDEAEQASTTEQASGQKPSPVPRHPSQPEQIPMTADEVRAEFTDSASHKKYAIRQIKVARDDAQYLELLEQFITQCEAFDEFKTLGGMKRHFMFWLGKKPAATTNFSQKTNGNATGSKRTGTTLGSKAIGAVDYRGTGSTFDVEL